MIHSKHYQITANSSWRLLIQHKLHIIWGTWSPKMWNDLSWTMSYTSSSLVRPSVFSQTHKPQKPTLEQAYCVFSVIYWSSLNSLCFCCCCCCSVVLFPLGPQGPGFSTVVVKTDPQLHFNISSNLRWNPSLTHFLELLNALCIALPWIFLIVKEFEGIQCLNLIYTNLLSGLHCLYCKVSSFLSCLKRC